MDNQWLNMKKCISDIKNTLSDFSKKLEETKTISEHNNSKFQYLDNSLKNLDKVSSTLKIELDNLVKVKVNNDKYNQDFESFENRLFDLNFSKELTDNKFIELDK